MGYKGVNKEANKAVNVKMEWKDNSIWYEFEYGVLYPVWGVVEKKYVGSTVVEIFDDKSVVGYEVQSDGSLKEKKLHESMIELVLEQLSA